VNIFFIEIKLVSLHGKNNNENLTMDDKGYPYINRNIDDLKLYYFISKNQQTGLELVKAIQFSETQTPNRYNLGLADYVGNGVLDYEVVSDNGDLRIVLTTIVSIIFDFFVKNPEKEIEIRANSLQRLKLYHFVIRSRFQEFESRFQILGMIQYGEPEIFENFNVNTFYEGFFIKTK
jgi:hypothetical protein